jgi:hypothetical protein
VLHFNGEKFIKKINMAMGIFEQLAWLTTRVKRLCCAIKVGALQSRNIDITPFEGGPGYDIMEGGIYQFYGGNGTTVFANYAYPTSVGQTMYIINSSSDTLTTSGLSPADRPFLGGETGTPMSDILPYEVWQLISVDGTPFGAPGLVWRGFRLYDAP